MLWCDMNKPIESDENHNTYYHQHQQQQQQQLQLQQQQLKQQYQRKQQEPSVQAAPLPPALSYTDTVLVTCECVPNVRNAFDTSAICSLAVDVHITNLCECAEFELIVVATNPR